MRDARLTALSVALLLVAVYLPQLIGGGAAVLPGARQIVIVRETADDTPAFAKLKLQLRFAKELEQHELYIYDDDSTAAESFKPGVTILTLDGRLITHVDTIPSTFAAFVALVQKSGG